MRKFCFILLAFFTFSVAVAQETLIIEGAKPAFYINHKVAPKENYYSVGRLFNVSPKEIAPFNNMDLGKGLSLGQSIKIPLTATNFSQTGLPVQATEAGIPVYHLVQPNETLSKVAASYNVPSANIKKWNNLKTESLIKGSKLIIGYLKVSKELSAFANKSIKKAPLTEAVTAPAKTPETPVTATSTTKAVEKIETANTENKVSKPTEEIKTSVVNTPAGKSSLNFNGGFFKSLYEEQMKNKSQTNENGLAGVFKTTSGWQDGKYYCFSNTAPQGTILKINNPRSGKSIYAKVLDLIPDIKQNANFLIQLSNAAADELGITDPKFDCTVTYFK